MSSPHRSFGFDVNEPSELDTSDYGGDEDDDTPIARTLVELQMMSLSRAIRRKDRWAEKLDDPIIVGKWREEALAQEASEEMINFVLRELKEVYLPLKDGPVEMSGVDGVYQADKLISEDLKQELQRGVALLENVPENEKDWHPGSDNQVLDLVHPSLYCLVSDVTVVTSSTVPYNCLMGKTAQAGRDSTPEPKKRRVDINESATYQWLPSEVDVSADGHVRIRSYINNLHPIKNGGLYHTLSRILERFVPLFERVLTFAASEKGFNRIYIDSKHKWYEDDPEGGSPESDSEDRGSGSDPDSERSERRRAKLIPPKIPTDPYMLFDPDHPVNLRGRRLQVIIKMANIVLTPTRPNFPGGVWHVEGMRNERIVASGIYYYKSENISESLLHFRQAVRDPTEAYIPQDDNYAAMRTYGMRRDSPLNQEIGEVETIEDRCIVFPNTYQHRVAPFTLLDKSVPGVRKILVFFLVDPDRPITSTAHVAAQQATWQLGFLRSGLAGSGSQLPDDVLTRIVNFVGGMTLDEAKLHRERLMRERKFFVIKHTREVFLRPFSLCEH